MSRTFKDRPIRFKHTRFELDYEFIGLSNGRYSVIYRKTTRPKKRKEVDTTYHWMSTPSWWTRLTMIRPQRRNYHLQEVKLLKAVDLEDFDFVDTKNKPHNYYW